jgi:hypothetical protein
MQIRAIYKGPGNVVRRTYKEHKVVVQIAIGDILCGVLNIDFWDLTRLPRPRAMNASLSFPFAVQQIFELG